MAGKRQMAFVCFQRLPVSSDRIVNFLDDAVVREAVIPLITHGNDEMLVHLDADDVARLNDSCCHGLILP